MTELIDKATKIIASSKYIVAFTGAGISTESGIPDFRSTDGIWSKFDPYEYGSYEGFLIDPTKYWTMGKESRNIIIKAEPNAAHKALAALEHDYGKLKSIITQNVDFLHSKAGNTKIYELHGTYKNNFCMECKKEFTLEEVLKQLNSDIMPPSCDCGGVIKSASVLFGEIPPVDVLNEARRELQKCDCLIVIGTSLTVQPAASMPLLAAANGSKIIIINKDPTHSDHLGNVVIHERAAAVMDDILGNMKKLDLESSGE